MVVIISSYIILDSGTYLIGAKRRMHRDTYRWFTNNRVPFFNTSTLTDYDVGDCVVIDATNNITLRGVDCDEANHSAICRKGKF